VIEGHSWPEHGDPRAQNIGWRHYGLPQSTNESLASIDILNAWQSTHKPYHLYLINDELAWSKLPSYIPARQRVAVIKESPIHVGEGDPGIIARHFDLALTHLKKQIDYGPPFTLLTYSSNTLGLTPSQRNCNLPVESEKDRLCSFIGNLNHNPDHLGYKMRREAYQSVCGDRRVDCFGRDTNPINSKSQALRRYAFSIAMENAREDYYFTEKLIDCILMGTIPIYWGCPSIGNFFDPRGILSFNNAKELKEIVNSLTWQLYKQMHRYAVANFNTLIDEKRGDFHGYLERALDQIKHSSAIQNRPTPHQLSFSSASRAIAAWRRLRGT
jgi:hypothetical protein